VPLVSLCLGVSRYQLTLPFSGILGREIVKELCSRPEEWSSIYAMSRSKKEDFGPRVKHVHLDLTAAAETMSEDLKDVEADYVFFAAYLQQDSEEESTRVNGNISNIYIQEILVADIT
jgi:nucleoside-diphosphate-sugar epimerase